MGLVFAASAGAEAPAMDPSAPGTALAGPHELVLTNDSSHPVRIEFLDLAGASVWCSNTAGIPRAGPSFPIAPRAALHCLLDAGRYRILVHRRLARLADGSLWEAEEKTVDVK